MSQGGKAKRIIETNQKLPFTNSNSNKAVSDSDNDKKNKRPRVSTGSPKAVENLVDPNHQSSLASTLDFILEELKDHKELMVTKEDLDQQTDTLSGNLESVTEQLREANAKIQSLQNLLDKAMNEIGELKEENQELKRLSFEAIRLANDNNQRSCRDNIKIFGLPKTVGEGRHSICNFFKEQMDIDVTPEEIFAAHRIKGVAGKNDPMVVRFRDHDKRDKIIKNKTKVKMANVAVKHHLTAANSGLVNRIFNHPRYKFAHTSINSMKIFAVTDDNFRLQVRLFEDLNELYDKRKKIGTKLEDRPSQHNKTSYPKKTLGKTEFSYFNVEV